MTLILDERRRGLLWDTARRFVDLDGQSDARQKVIDAYSEALDNGTATLTLTADDCEYLHELHALADVVLQAHWREPHKPQSPLIGLVTAYANLMANGGTLTLSETILYERSLARLLAEDA